MTVNLELGIPNCGMHGQRDSSQESGINHYGLFSKYPTNTTESLSSTDYFSIVSDLKKIVKYNINYTDEPEHKIILELISFWDYRGERICTCAREQQPRHGEAVLTRP